MKTLTMTLVAAAALLAGCGAMPGPQEGATPPKIVATKDGNVWDNPGAFGPVPAALAANGAKVCESMNTNNAAFVAKGYHAKAMDVNGSPFAGGGYFCMQK